MRVILLKDIKKLGHAYEIVDVKDGYALNFLIPQKLSIPATKAALREAETRRTYIQERKHIDNTLFIQNLTALTEAHIIITVKANEKKHLYNAVSAEEISVAVKAQTRIDLPAEVIKLEKPIKELGTFIVPVSTNEIFGSFSITIVAEQ